MLAIFSSISQGNLPESLKSRIQSSRRKRGTSAALPGAENSIFPPSSNFAALSNLMSAYPGLGLPPYLGLANPYLASYGFPPPATSTKDSEDSANVPASIPMIFPTAGMLMNPLFAQSLGGFSLPSNMPTSFASLLSSAAAADSRSWEKETKDSKSRGSENKHREGKEKDAGTGDRKEKENAENEMEKKKEEDRQEEERDYLSRNIVEESAPVNLSTSRESKEEKRKRKKEKRKLEFQPVAESSVSRQEEQQEAATAETPGCSEDAQRVALQESQEQQGEDVEEAAEEEGAQ